MSSLERFEIQEIIVILCPLRCPCNGMVFVDFGGHPKVFLVSVCKKSNLN